VGNDPRAPGIGVRVVFSFVRRAAVGSGVWCGFLGAITFRCDLRISWGAIYESLYWDVGLPL